MDSSDYDKMVQDLTESSLYCVFVKDATEWIRAVSVANLKHTDRIGVFGNNTRVTVQLYKLHYADGIKNDMERELLRSRMDCIKTVYYRWCSSTGHTPNPKEGWFKSKRFTAFLNEIKYYQMNYVIALVVL